MPADRLTFSRIVVLYGLILVLSLAWFALVRNNTFWHSRDFLFLQQAIDIDQSWRAIFEYGSTPGFQPLIKLVFYLEYTFFALDAWKYYLFNIFIHSINAFLVFFLVYRLLRDQLIAVLSSLLFAVAVGNYGKAVMVVSGIGDLLITMLTLLTLLLYIENELHRGGRALSFWYIASLVCFLLSLMTKATSFSILGCMLSFNMLYSNKTKKPVFHRGFIVIAVVALIAFIARLSLLPAASAFQDMHFNLIQIVRTSASYLVRMIFPIHGSYLVTHAGPAVQFFYQVATEMRVITFLCILSYSVFGFIFGNRTIRFFIMWTYITVLPFCFFHFPGDWLNIRYLYLVSIGFIMLLASATVLASRLLYQKAWRRFLPYAVPLVFVMLSHFIIRHLDESYERTSRMPHVLEMETALEDYQNSFRR